MGRHAPWDLLNGSDGSCQAPFRQCATRKTAVFRRLSRFSNFDLERLPVLAAERDVPPRPPGAIPGEVRRQARGWLVRPGYTGRPSIRAELASREAVGPQEKLAIDPAACCRSLIRQVLL